MNCQNCQKLLSDDAKFCSGCGQAVDPSLIKTLPPDTDPLVGLVLGKYGLKKLLGEGAMGKVYLASHTFLGGDFAVKILHPNWVGNSQAANRFWLEALAAFELRHPNVVRVRDFDKAVGPHQPYTYIVMEYLDGPSLDKVLENEGRLALEQAIPLMLDICAGLGAAHKRKILHRDLKPANLVWLAADDSQEREKETVKVIDFGLAKLRDANLKLSLTPFGTAIGTPYYMSPEGWAGQELDERSDVYSLGVTFYELLAGVKPFQGNTLLVLMDMHCKSAPPPFDATLNIPTKLADVIMQALAKPPDDRPADANELGRLIQEAVSPTLASFSFETVTVNEQGDIIKRHKKQASYYAEDLHGLGLEMVEIPAGRFLMGAPKTEANSYDDETPQHWVTIGQPFFVGKYAVTQKQWRVVAGWPKVSLDLNPDPSYFKGDDLPVENVSWFDTTEFCLRLQQATGRAYRLPSEAEWEYSCRAKTTTPFPYGPTITPEIVNYDGNYPYGQAKKGLDRGQTFPVNSGIPNRFGLYNICGNVWEWCLDEWREDYNGAPDDGSARGDITNVSLTDSTFRVLRGGSWGDLARYCRSANRGRNDPAARNRYFGFRVVVAAR